SAMSHTTSVRSCGVAMRPGPGAVSNWRISAVMAVPEVFVFRHSGAARSAEPGTQRLLHPWSGKPKSLGPGSPLRGVRDDANFFVTPIFRHSGESRNSSDFGPGMTTTKYPLARIFFHQLITCTPSPPEPLTWY